MQELWKPIKGYEKEYEISNFGRVKSLNRKYTKGRVLKLHKHSTGYIYCCLSKNGKVANKRVHILVAQAFVENKKNLPIVNHINEQKEDNKASNLEWCTHSYNSNYGTKSAKMVNSKKVIAIDINDKIVASFPSTAEAGRNGYNSAHIVECCNNKRKTHKKLRWVYI